MADIPSRQIAGRWVRPELIVEPSAVRVRVGIQVEEPGELLGDAIAVTLRAGAETLAAVSAPDPAVPLPCASTGATYAWAEFVFANPRGLVPTAIVIALGEPTATFDLADVTPSAPPPPPPPPVSLSFPVLRPDDLVNLRVDTVNLALDTRDPQQPLLVHADAEREALLIVRFAPQTIVEEAFFESGGTEQKIDPGEARQNPPTIATTPSDPGKVAARIGEETRLVFRVPGGASIRYSVAGLLDWSALELVVTPAADVAPGATPPAGALAIRAPGPTETTLQLPYRLHLSPAGDVVWDHAGAAVVHGGRAELWHTRLATPTPAGGIPPIDEQHTVALRAIWSPDYTTGPLPSPADLQPLGRLAAMSGYDRHQIVVLTSAFRGFAADEFRAYVPMPVTASLLMLSALGGWLRSFGKWEPPYRIVEGPWRDVIASEDLIRVITEAVSHRVQRRLAPAEQRPEAAPRAEAIAPAEQIAHASARVRDALTLARGRDSVDIGMLRIPRYELGQQLDLSQWA
ncbi:MAG TPA: hypothetical protein VD836_12750, partial [Solirubrobacteraceae bacterium]|nr:hypothetical protein [Solirubrobacteraceae bacterium]